LAIFRAFLGPFGAKITEFNHFLFPALRVPVDGQEVVPLGNEDAEGFPVCRAMQKTAHKPAPWKYLLVISTFAPPRLLLLAYVSKKGTTS
jgi:hypothetical protein